MLTKNTYIQTVGWVSSVALILTMAKQLFKQWQERTSQGVSKWLYLGQLASGIGFVIYSLLLNNSVFVFTNLIMLIINAAGFFLVMKHRKTS